MAFFIQLEQRGLFPFASKSVQNRIFSIVHFEIGREWHRRFKPLHFGNSATTRYGYGRRSGESGNMPAKGFNQSYTGRKLAIKKHTRPLEWSGDSMRSVMASNTIRATRFGVTVAMHAPNLNYRNPHSQIDMRAELTRVLPEENAHLAKVAQAKFQQLGHLIPLEKVRIG